MNIELNILVCKNIDFEGVSQLILDDCIAQDPTDHKAADQWLGTSLGVVVSVLQPVRQHAGCTAQQSHHPIPAENMILVEFLEYFVHHFENVLGEGVLIVPAMQKIPHGLLFCPIIVPKNRSVHLGEGSFEHNSKYYI